MTTPARARRSWTVAVRYRLGGLLPGAAARRRQVPVYAAEWQADNAAAERGSGPLWVALGDSASQAIGASTRAGGYVLRVLAALRERDPSWRVVNLSVTGARIADVVTGQLPALAALAQRGEPALVTVAIGMNDLRHRTADPAGALTDLFARLPAGSVVGTIPQGLHEKRARAVNAVVRQEAERRGLVVADLWAATGPPWRGKFSADLFHPNDTGYQDWARAFLTALAARGLVDAPVGS